MSPSAHARLVGFRVLLAHAGETLTSGELEFKSIVKRGARKLRDGITPQGTLNFGILGITEIEYFKAGNPEPKDGLVYADEFSVQHRVMAVFDTEFTWIVYAKPSPTS